MLSVSLSLNVNQGGTNRNRCTHIFVILRAQTYYWTLIAYQKLGHTDLLYGSKSPTEKSGREYGIFKPAELHSPRVAR